MTRLDGAYAAMQAELDDITHKVADNEALELRHAISIAHWCGIAQGVVSREAHPPAPSERARVVAFYESQPRLARLQGEECVLEIMGSVGLTLLRAWAEVGVSTKPTHALLRLIAQSELFRRGEGPDPRDTIGKGTSG